jgi:hypothetical protein
MTDGNDLVLQLLSENVAELFSDCHILLTGGEEGREGRGGEEEGGGEERRRGEKRRGGGMWP